MLNYLWGILMVAGLGCSILCGSGRETGLAVINCSKEAVNLCIAMLGVMGLWMGIMEIAVKSGVINKLTKLFSPIIKILFPDIPEDSKARDYIASNFIANMLGLGWAATPIGLKAMRELKKLNNNTEVASCDMCTFLIINISSLQLIPMNVIAYRSQYGSANPSSIIGQSICATGVSTIAGVFFSILVRKCIELKKNNKKI